MSHSTSAISRRVVYRGEPFHLQSSGRYYSSGRKNVEERLLHRRVWSESNGPIPEGFVVHHKDGDWTNNHIDNLELKFEPDHAREHVVERWADPEQAKRFKRGLEKAREAAPEWHASPEGIKWHTDHGKKTWEKRQRLDRRCVRCASGFKSYWPRAKFCSKKCRNADFYERHK